jgi:sortase A
VSEPRIERRTLLAGALGATVLGAAGVAAVVLRDTDADGAAPASTNATNGATTSTTAAPTPVTVPSADIVPVELPDPDGPPGDAYADVPINQIGAVTIPKIGLDHAVYEGIWLTVLDEGPGHWPGSALPGQLGNAVFPGHRVTHSHPFRRLDELVPGDEITFTMANGTHTYAVRETLIVSPKDMWVVDQAERSEVTLIACHPPHSARQRIVVKGDLRRSEPNAAAAAAAADIADATASIPL